jgi:lipoyl(octanoyl) transferase
VGRPVGVLDVLPVLQTRLAELLAWAPYAATPDYAPRPDPAQKSSTPQPRIELVRP